MTEELTGWAVWIQFTQFYSTKLIQVLRHRPQQIEYNAKRLPSYCDRVCHKSLPGLAGRLAVTHYDWCPDFNTSDHKPVRAAYEIDPAPDLYTCVRALGVDGWCGVWGWGLEVSLTHMRSASGGIHHL